MTRRLRLYLGLLLSAVFSAIVLYLVVRDLDWGAALTAIGQMNIVIVLVCGIMLTLALAARGLRWYDLAQGQLTRRRAFRLTNIAFFINNVIPFRVGDLLRIELAAHSEDSIPRATALSVAVVERLIDLLSLVVIFLLSLLSIETIPVGVQQTTLVFGIFAFGLSAAIMLTVTLLRERTLLLVDRIGARIPLVKRLHPLVANLLDGLAVVGAWRHLLLALLWNAIVWVLTVVPYWLLTATLFPDVPLMIGGLMLVAVAFAITVPTTIASLGVIEGSVVLVLTSQGYTYEGAFAVGLVLHAVTLLGYALLGLFSMGREALGFGAVWARMTAAPATGEGAV